jgi:hypothetical protein
MKFIVYLMTLLFVGTAIAQNPTILQGNYITNVFGNSNFVLNPNAQTSVANVTTVTATVTRSTATPLVATSEFTVAIGTANGTATWATRAFDAGMKGQNCEARFSYRGFAATSKVHIKQGANTVASLNLTPATDPRIASINFPCGDLSNPTTFQVTDTAILAGTNEIGGIYVGLATNMANVAQAELVVSANRTTTQSITNGVSTTVIFANENNDVYGEYDPATGIFTAKRSGEYFVQSMILYGSAAWTAGNSIDLNIMRDSNVICSQNYRIQYTSTTFHGNQASCHVTITVGQQIKVQTYQDRGSATDLIGTGSAIYNRLQIYRFPSSSELVVTPERQNWYVSAYQGDSGSYPALGLATVASFTEITASGGTMTPESGSQPVAALCQNGTSPATLSTSTTNCGATNESLGIAFAIPTVGSYEVCAEFTHAPNQTTPNSTLDVYFQLAETNTNNTTILQSFTAANNGSQVISSGFLDQRTLSPCRVFVFNSVGTKAVRLLYRQTVSGTLNGNVMTIDTNNSRALRWKIQPVTNQSNSALYVQGPVKAAETGAAIPAGYVGEKVTWATAPTATVFGTSVADWTNATISLNPGVHLIIANIQTFVESGTTAGNDSECNAQITDSAGTIIDTQSKSLRAKSAATGQSGVNLGVVAMSTIVNVTAASTVYKIRAKRTDNSGTGYCELSNSAQKQSHFYAIRIN